MFAVIVWVTTALTWKVRVIMDNLFYVNLLTRNVLRAYFNKECIRLRISIKISL